MSEAYQKAADYLFGGDVSALLEDVDKLSKEVRVTSETGGQKGAKDIEFARLPDTIADVAKHFHDGSTKYPDPAPGVANWSLGYAWSLSINALHRHMDAWERGEDIDEEFGNSHLAAVCFHALVLMWFQKHGVGTDDRYTVARRNAHVAAQAGE